MKETRNRINGNQVEADRLVLEFTRNADSLEVEEIEALALIATGEAARNFVEQLAGKTAGLAVPRLVELATGIAERNGNSKAMEWISSRRVGGKP